MSYLIGQILFCLFFAGMTGFAVGWLFRGASRSAAAPAASAELPSPAQARRNDVANEALEKENAELRRRLEAGMRRLREIEQNLSTGSAQADAAGNREELAALSQQAGKERERADALESSLHDTQTALAEKARALASRDALLAKQSDTLQSLERRLASNSEVIKSASEAAEKHRVSAETASRIAEQVSAMDARLRDYDSESGRHDETIDRLGKNIAAVTEQAITMRGELTGARQRLADAEARDKEQEQARSESDAGLAARLASAREQLGKMQTQMLERDQVIAALRRRLQNATAAAAQQELPIDPPVRQAGPSDQPPWLLSQPDGKPDDLKRIYGIGPVLERTLNELGVFHFRQIAALSATDVAWLASRINSFPDRIIRDRWVEQAQELG
ncbi:MAG: hypothetical protein AAFN78_04600 [Pseudomonadota bacterium]